MGIGKAVLPTPIPWVREKIPFLLEALAIVEEDEVSGS
jgi:hypothetical protein